MRNFKHDNSSVKGFINNWLDYRNIHEHEWVTNPTMVANDFVNFAASTYEEYNTMWEILRDAENIH